MLTAKGYRLSSYCRTESRRLPVQVSLHDEPDGGAEDDPEDEQDPLVHVILGDVLEELRVLVVRVEVRERDEEQHGPQSRRDFVVAGEVAHLAGGLVKPVDAVDAAGDDEQKDLHEHVTALDGRVHGASPKGGGV